MDRGRHQPSDEDANAADGESATERRIRAMMDVLLDQEALSDEVRAIVRHVDSSDRKLEDMTAEELEELLLEALE